MSSALRLDYILAIFSTTLQQSLFFLKKNNLIICFFTIKSLIFIKVLNIFLVWQFVANIHFFFYLIISIQTRYGEVKDIFLDAAKEDETDMHYLFDSWFSLIHQLQPGAIVFSDLGPDTRWAGNESGAAGSTCWSLYNKTGYEIGYIDNQ